MASGEASCPLADMRDENFPCQLPAKVSFLYAELSASLFLLIAFNPKHLFFMCFDMK